MKRFVLISLFLLIDLPAFAQQCEEGDVHLVREGNIVSLKECRSGTLNYPLVENFNRFLEVRGNDLMSVSKLIALNISICGFGDCLLATQNRQDVVLYAAFENVMDMDQVFSLRDFADSYRGWLTENGRKTNNNSVQCYTKGWTTIIDNEYPNNGCWLFQCEGIEGVITLEPSNLMIDAEFINGAVKHAPMIAVDNMYHPPHEDNQ